MSGKSPLSPAPNVSAMPAIRKRRGFGLRILEWLAPALTHALAGRWTAYWLCLALDIYALHALARDRMAFAVLAALGSRLLSWSWLCRARVLPEGAWAAQAHRTIPTSHASREARTSGALAMLVYLAALTLQGVALGSAVMQARFAQFPAAPALRVQVELMIDATVQWLTVHWQTAFDSLTHGMSALLSTVESALAAVPWPLALLLLTFFAWRRGRLPLAALTSCALLYFGLFGFWDKAVTTIALVLAAFIACLVIGLPLGVLAAKHRRVKAVIMPCLDVMQTMPSFVYLLPAVAFFSIGKPPALVATVIFALPPLIRLSCLGLEQVPLVVQEAMYAHGATRWQTLIKAELPLAAPSIRAGINQSIMMSLSMVVIAALIGGGGLGYDVLFALQNVQYGRGILAGLAIVLCAIVFDRLVKDQQHATALGSSQKNSH